MEESIIVQLEDLFTHKKYFLDSAMKMSKYLDEHGENDLAVELLKRAVEHDNSKLNSDELNDLKQLGGSFSSLKDPKEQLGDGQKKLIERHWKNNRHHPEFFTDAENMDEIDIIEMVCDWHSRSEQFKTDLLKFVEIRQRERFHFSDEMYKKIIKYCKVLVN